MISNYLHSSKLSFLVLLVLLATLCATAASAQTSQLPTPKIFAQKIVNETLAAHPELQGLEISSAYAQKDKCQTIASDEAKGIGENCDQDEYTAMESNKPFVDLATDEGKKFYDVNIPIHDASGKVIAIVGIDFKPDPKQTEAQASEQAEKIAKEIEAKVPTREKLFEPQPAS